MMSLMAKNSFLGTDLAPRTQMAPRSHIDVVSHTPEAERMSLTVTPRFGNSTGDIFLSTKQPQIPQAQFSQPPSYSMREYNPVRPVYNSGPGLEPANRPNSSVLVAGGDRNTDSRQASHSHASSELSSPRQSPVEGSSTPVAVLYSQSWDFNCHALYAPESVCSPGGSSELRSLANFIVWPSYFAELPKQPHTVQAASSFVTYTQHISCNPSNCDRRAYAAMASEPMSATPAFSRTPNICPNHQRLSTPLRQPQLSFANAEDNASYVAPLAPTDEARSAPTKDAPEDDGEDNGNGTGRACAVQTQLKRALSEHKKLVEEIMAPRSASENLRRVLSDSFAAQGSESESPAPLPLETKTRQQAEMSPPLATPLPTDPKLWLDAVMRFLRSEELHSAVTCWMEIARQRYAIKPDAAGDLKTSSGFKAPSASPGAKKVLLPSSNTKANIVSSSPRTKANILSLSSRTKANFLSPISRTKVNSLSPSSSTKANILSSSSSTKANILSPSSKTNVNVLSSSSSTKANILSLSSRTKVNSLSPSSSTNANILSSPSSAKACVLSSSSSTKVNTLSPSSKTNVNVLSSSSSTKANILSLSSSINATILSRSSSTKDVFSPSSNTKEILPSSCNTKEILSPTSSTKDILSSTSSTKDNISSPSPSSKDNTLSPSSSAKDNTMSQSSSTKDNTMSQSSSTKDNPSLPCKKGNILQKQNTSYPSPSTKHNAPSTKGPNEIQSIPTSIPPAHRSRPVQTCPPLWASMSRLSQTSPDRTTGRSRQCQTSPSPSPTASVHEPSLRSTYSNPDHVSHLTKEEVRKAKLDHDLHYEQQKKRLTPDSVYSRRKWPPQKAPPPAARLISRRSISLCSRTPALFANGASPSESPSLTPPQSSQSPRFSIPEEQTASSPPKPPHLLSSVLEMIPSNITMAPGNQAPTTFLRGDPPVRMNRASEIRQLKLVVQRESKDTNTRQMKCSRLRQNRRSYVTSNNEKMLRINASELSPRKPLISRPTDLPKYNESEGKVAFKMNSAEIQPTQTNKSQKQDKGETGREETTENCKNESVSKEKVFSENICKTKSESCLEVDFPVSPPTKSTSRLREEDKEKQTLPASNTAEAKSEVCHETPPSVSGVNSASRSTPLARDGTISENKTHQTLMTTIMKARSESCCQTSLAASSQVITRNWKCTPREHKGIEVPPTPSTMTKTNACSWTTLAAVSQFIAPAPRSLMVGDKEKQSPSLTSTVAKSDACIGTSTPVTCGGVSQSLAFVPWPETKADEYQISSFNKVATYSDAYCANLSSCATLSLFPWGREEQINDNSSCSAQTESEQCCETVSAPGSLTLLAWSQTGGDVETDRTPSACSDHTDSEGQCPKRSERGAEGGNVALSDVACFSMAPVQNLSYPMVPSCDRLLAKQRSPTTKSSCFCVRKSVSAATMIPEQQSQEPPRKRVIFQIQETKKGLGKILQGFGQDRPRIKWSKEHKIQVSQRANKKVGTSLRQTYSGVLLPNKPCCPRDKRNKNGYTQSTQTDCWTASTAAALLSKKWKSPEAFLPMFRHSLLNDDVRPQSWSSTRDKAARSVHPEKSSDDVQNVGRPNSSATESNIPNRGRSATAVKFSDNVPNVEPQSSTVAENYVPNITRITTVPRPQRTAQRGARSSSESRCVSAGKRQCAAASSVLSPCERDARTSPSLWSSAERGRDGIGGCVGVSPIRREYGRGRDMTPSATGCGYTRGVTTCPPPLVDALPDEQRGPNVGWFGGGFGSPSFGCIESSNGCAVGPCGNVVQAPCNSDGGRAAQRGYDAGCGNGYPPVGDCGFLQCTGGYKPGNRGGAGCGGHWFSQCGGARGGECPTMPRLQTFGCNYAPQQMGCGSRVSPGSNLYCMVPTHDSCRQNDIPRCQIPVPCPPPPPPLRLLADLGPMQGPCGRAPFAPPPFLPCIGPPTVIGTAIGPCPAHGPVPGTPVLMANPMMQPCLGQQMYGFKPCVSGGDVCGGGLCGPTFAPPYGARPGVPAPVCGYGYSCPQIQQVQVPLVCYQCVPQPFSSGEECECEDALTFGLRPPINFFRPDNNCRETCPPAPCYDSS